MQEKINTRLLEDRTDNNHGKVFESWILVIIGLSCVTILLILFKYKQDYNLTALNISSEENYVMNEALYIFGLFSIVIIISTLIFGLKKKDYKYRMMQQEYESVIAKNQRTYSSFMKAANVGTWEWSIQTGNIQFNERWSDMIGYSVEELAGIKIDEWLKMTHPDDAYFTRMETAKILSGEVSYYDIECRMKHKDGQWIWVHDRGEIISWTEDGKPLSMTGTYIDITEKKINHSKFVDSNAKYKSIIEVSNTGVWEFDVSNDYLWCSEAYFNMLGYDPKIILQTSSQNLQNLWTKYLHPDDIDTAQNNFLSFLNQDEVEYYDNHFRMKRKDGDWAWIWSRGKLSRDNNMNVKFVVGTHIDITEMKRAQEKIQYLSYRDTLTGLYNRRYYEEKLKIYNNQSSCKISLILFDVNGLKLVNDAFGHLEGDRLLKTVGEILKNNCHEQDIVARIGGDEFIIISENFDEKNIDCMVSNIMEDLEHQVIKNIPISISCGWAVRTGEQDSVEFLFKRAEDVMYHNKAADRKSLRYQSVQIIMKTLNEKIPREEAHSKRVSDLCLEIGRRLKLGSTQLKNLQTAAMLHDIGKIGISNDILNKEGPLNEEEWLEIKKHPKISYNILSSVNEYGPLADIVLSHHERWDGKGYPNMMQNQEIPLQARIIAIADAYDAMVSDRPYRNGMDEDKALAIIRNESGKQFDPGLVKIFLELF